MSLTPADPVEAGVHHDPVQPGRNGRVAAEVAGGAMRRQERILQRVGGFLPVGEGTHGDRPESVAVPVKELGEGLGITRDVCAQQLGIAPPAVAHGCTISVQGDGAGAAEAGRMRTVPLARLNRNLLHADLESAALLGGRKLGDPHQQVLELLTGLESREGHLGRALGLVWLTDPGV